MGRAMNWSKVLLMLLVAVGEHSSANKGADESPEAEAGGEGLPSVASNGTRRDTQWEAIAGPVEYIPVQKISYIPKKTGKKNKQQPQKGTENDYDQDSKQSVPNADESNPPSNTQPKQQNPGKQDQKQIKTDPLHGIVGLKPRPKKNRPNPEQPQIPQPLVTDNPPEPKAENEEINQNPSKNNEIRPPISIDEKPPYKNEDMLLNIKKGNKGRYKKTNRPSNLPPPHFTPFKANQHHEAGLDSPMSPFVHPGTPEFPLHANQGNVVDPNIPFEYNQGNIPEEPPPFGHNEANIQEAIMTHNQNQGTFGMHPFNPNQINAQSIPTDGSMFSTNHFTPKEKTQHGEAPNYGYNEGPGLDTSNLKQTGDVYNHEIMNPPQENGFPWYGADMKHPNPEFGKYRPVVKKSKGRSEPIEYPQYQGIQPQLTNTDMFRQDNYPENSYLADNVEEEDTYNLSLDSEKTIIDEGVAKHVANQNDETSVELEEISENSQQPTTRPITGMENSQGGEQLSETGKQQVSEENRDTLEVTGENAMEGVDNGGGEERSSEEGLIEGRYVMEVKKNIVHARAEAIGKFPGNKPVRAQALAVADKPGQVAHAEAFATSGKHLPKLRPWRSDMGVLQRLLVREIMRRMLLTRIRGQGSLQKMGRRI